MGSNKTKFYNIKSYLFKNKGNIILIMDWDMFEKETLKLSKMINYVPEILVAVIRGGLIPARLLSKYLNVKEMCFLQVSRYGKLRKIESNLNMETIMQKKRRR